MRQERACVDGFTLIEVVGAILLFSVALLMVIQLSGTMSTQLHRSAVSSELVILARERLDSLDRVAFDSVDVGTWADTVTVQGVEYSRSYTVSSFGPLLLEIDLSLAPLTAGDGPTYTAASFKAAPWEG